MAISKRLEDYLKAHEVTYRVMSHPRSHFSMETAEVAHVSGDSLAKGILAKEADGYLLVVLPSDYHIDLEILNKVLAQKADLATEAEVAVLFPDCELGAVPPIGPAYGIKTVWDPNTTLGRVNDVYFEAGDHQHLVHVSGKQFHELMAPAERGEFSHHI